MLTLLPPWFVRSEEQQLFGNLIAVGQKSREIVPKKFQNVCNLRMKPTMATIHELGPFRLDEKAEILFRGAEPVALGHRAVALLRVLVEQAGVPVSKDALIEAAWPGLAVEDGNLTVQIAALRRVFEEEPGGKSWIETLPRRGYRYIGPTASAEGLAAAKTIAAAEPLALPDRPSIAVLPFQNLSGDPEQEYFADGIVEDIITALSRVPRLFVIARNSCFTFKGRVVDVKQVGRELGVRYVLEGSVRKAANRVRITGELVDASTGRHLWADHFDGGLDDIFDLQDRVTASVVGAIAPKLEQAEIERSKRKPTDSLDAYDYFLRGMSNVYIRTNEANSKALHFFSMAIQLDSDFAAAYGMAAWCYAWRKMNGWMADRAQEIAEAARLAKRAVELGTDDPIALARGGATLAFVFHDLDSGIAYVDRALLLNPNLATSWYISGWLRAYRGEPDMAVEHQARAMRLSPLDPILGHMQAGTALAHLLAGRYNEASSWTEKAFWDQSYLPAASVAAASNALVGKFEKATHAMGRVRQIDPALSMRNLKDWFPIRRTEHFAKFADGMRKAGLPE